MKNKYNYKNIHIDSVNNRDLSYNDYFDNNQNI